MTNLCECGCGEETRFYRGKHNRYISGHNGRGKVSPKKGKKSGYPVWNKGLTKNTDKRIMNGINNRPKNRKKPRLSNAQREAKRISFIGKNNPNFNPNKSEFQKYKISCKFKFDLGKYPDEFEMYKIRSMFHPTKNKKRYTRDHILIIYDGFKNKIDPKIISHPTNCKLMLHADNSRKNKESLIKLNALINKIAAWDGKYGKNN